jgi:integrase
MTDHKKIGLREVRGLKAGEILWDSAVAGFGIRRQNSTAVAYVLFYRTKEGRQRWHTIGRHGAPWTPEEAREKAREILGDVTKGLDPAADKKATRKAATVAELCDLYWADAEAGRLLTRRKVPKKASTLATDKGRIERHIKPMLGRLKVGAVTSRDIEDFMNDVAEGKTAGKTKTAKKRGLANVRGGKGTASRTVGLLGGIFTYAIRHRMRPDNPVRGVMRFADKKRERRLNSNEDDETKDEYKMLGKALLKAEAQSIWPSAIAATRFLALTGWRSGEALNLLWEEIDLAKRTAVLPDSKTGRSMRPLSHAACNVLRGLTRRKNEDLVFQATRGDGPMIGYPKLWARIIELSHDEKKTGKTTSIAPIPSKKKKGVDKQAGLPDDITPHVLRHSFISLAADLGYSELTIAALVGHKGHSVTSRYVHSADAVLLEAADKVANKTAELMGMPINTADVIPLLRAKS